MIKKKNILFICKYNRFRSKIAEFLFNKFNDNKNYHALSAGIIRGSPVDVKQKKACIKIGISLKGEPVGMSSKLLKWQDIIVVVANDVPSVLFKENKKYGKKLIVWKIPDSKNDDERKIIKIAMAIEKKVKKFVKEMKNER